MTKVEASIIMKNPTTEKKKKKSANIRIVNNHSVGKITSLPMACVRVSVKISPTAMRRIIRCTSGVMTREEMIKRRKKTLKEYRDIEIS